ncbi:uncharacterized protein G2W53_000936 [Senna tora]|uniref:Retrotransposon Copia-like N-terminal domain-containing protein n=1 Tax=Senna tora TaxID=362788 RepID=A0A835CI62_9FABA|nr:uncharacterized protein G2W53_000936 [Senna tora]
MAENRELSTSTGNNEDSGGLKSSNSASELNYRRDPYYLHPFDTTGLQLVANQLNQSNYMIWSRSMVIALRSKNKLGFVDGSLKQPEDRSSDVYQNWSFVDSVVTRWLLNSMCTDLYEAYMFTPTAHEIWKELEEKYGTSNRPQIFHVKKRLALLVRDEIYSANYVDQFLMGLGEAYESVVDNILLMDPIPSYNKVYAMVARVEMQRSVNTSVTNVIEASAMMAKGSDQQKSIADAVNIAVSNAVNTRFIDRKKEKASRYCTHFSRNGHTADTCFRKHGYPEWFKEYKIQKGKKSVESVNAVLDDGGAGSSQTGSEANKRTMSKIIQEELKKMLKGKSGGDESPIHASYFADFAGNIASKSCDYFGGNDKGVKWIVDSGASSHITGNLSLLSDTRKPKGSNTVQLPDGVIKNVDQLTKQQLAHGKMVKNLYVLMKKEEVQGAEVSNMLVCNSRISDNDHVLWHDSRLQIPQSTSENIQIHSEEVDSVEEVDRDGVVEEEQAEVDASQNSNSGVLMEAGNERHRQSSREKKKPSWMKDFVTFSSFYSFAPS